MPIKLVIHSFSCKLIIDSINVYLGESWIDVIVKVRDIFRNTGK